MTRSEGFADGDDIEFSCETGIFEYGQISENVNSVGVYEVGGSVAKSEPNTAKL